MRTSFCLETEIKAFRFDFDSFYSRQKLDTAHPWAKVIFFKSQK